MTVKHPIPPAVLAQHTAFLGKTGSGKTSTAKLAVEQILRDDPKARVCVLDPIKSDWWGLTSSKSGQRPGLPFHILGGPRGHVPLPPSAGKAIGELVASGALPLSIIDMADFKLGGLQEFFNDFAPALLRKMRGVVHLVIEEAHEFAPKERAGFGGESMTMHYAKKLATAGRSKGIRLMVLTQRTQALHNAILGSCDTMIAHRLTAPADQKPVTDWLRASMSKEVYEEVAASLARLKTGTGWICSGEAQVAELVAFPPITTYDNSATPTGNDGDHHVKTAPVDADKLRTIIGSAVEEAEANNPATLKARIRELETAAAKKPAAAPAACTHSDDWLRKLSADSWREGRDAGATEARQLYGQRIANVGAELKRINDALMEPLPLLAPVASLAPERVTVPRGPVLSAPALEAMPIRREGKVAEGLSGPQQRILDALAWLASVGIASADRVRVAFLCDVSPKSSGFENNLGRLNTLGLIRYPIPGKAELTDEGRAVANTPETPPTNAALHASIRAKLPAPQWAILEVLIRHYAGALTRDAIAEACNVSAKSSSFENNLGALRSLGLIDYPAKGEAVALPVLFVE